MGYVVKPQDGLHFSTPRWPNCVIACVETGGVGEAVIVGVAPLGTIEYDSIGFVWGPNNLPAGDEGTFLNSLPAAANPILATLSDISSAVTSPSNLHDPGLPGSAPITIQNTNIGLRQYFSIVNGQMVVHNYP